MSGSLMKSAFIIIVVTLVGRLLGFIRNMFITSQFGAGMESTAYLAAYTIPLALSLVIPGAINAILIPSMKGLLTKHNENEAVLLYHKVLTLITLFFILLSVLGILFAEPIMTLLVPGLSEETHQLTVVLFRYMIPSSLFIGLMGLFASVLNVHNEFFVSSFGTVINGLIVLASFFVFVPFMGIQGLALGTTLGFVGFALIMIPSLYRRKYTLKINTGFNDPLMKSMGERLIPIMIGSAISQLTMFLEKMFVSQVGNAQLTALALANQIFQLPMAIFVGAFTLPLFPLLSEYVKKKDLKKMREVLEQGLLYLIILLLPVTLGLILLSKETVALLYQRGAFTAEDTKITAFALIFYSIGLLGLACRDLITRAFYALEDTKTPVTIGVVTIVLYIGFALAFMPFLQHGGIAFANSLAALCNTFILGFFLRKKLGWSLLSPTFYQSLGKALLATLLMGLAIWFIRGFTGSLVPLLSLPLLIGVGVLVYVLTLIALKEKIIWLIFARFTQKVNRKA